VDRCEENTGILVLTVARKYRGTAYWQLWRKNRALLIDSCEGNTGGLLIYRCEGNTEWLLIDSCEANTGILVLTVAKEI